MSVNSTPIQSGQTVIFFRAVQIILWGVGITLLAWSLLDPRFRDGEGFLTTAFFVPMAIGAAVSFIAATIRSRFRPFTLWFGLALVGQAVAFQLIDAGPRLHYQHYLPYPQLFTETSSLLWAFLAVQTVLVSAGVARRGAAIWRWLRSSFKLWQLVGIGFLFYGFAATVSPQIPVFAVELAFAGLLQTINLGNIILMAWALPADVLPPLESKFRRLFGPSVEPTAGEAIRLDSFALVVAVWVTVLAALLSYFAYEQHPHVPDEFAYLIHARYLAQGVLTMPAPPVPDAFESYLMFVVDKVWYPSPPPGWPAALAIGMLLGVPWLVNPVLAGANVLLSYLLLQELYSRRTARLGLLLLGFSPWFILMGMNFMTHMFTLLCTLLAVIGVAWARRAGRAGWAWLGGISLGMIAVIRPLEAAAMAGLLGLWAIGVGGKRLKLTSIAGLTLGALLVAVTVVLPYNKALTGHITKFPIMVYTDYYFGPNANALGFGPDRGMGWGIDPFPGHSPRDAFINAHLNTFSLNIELLGWSIGSMLLLGIIIFSGKLRRSDYLMLAVIAVIFWLHFFYYFSGGPDFGARYWFLMIIPLIALSARGLEFLAEKLNAASPLAGTRLLAAALVLGVMVTINYLPWRAIDKYHNFRGMRPDIRYMAETYDFGRSLVLIRGEGHPDYVSAAVYNPLDLQADAPIYVWDRSPEVRRQTLAAYADRPVWLIDGPSVTGGKFKITAGPLSAGELMDGSK